MLWREERRPEPPACGCGRAEDVWDMFGAGEETDGRDASMHSPNVKYPTEQVGPRTPVL